jgi:hypothetical protein
MLVSTGVLAEDPSFDNAIHNVADEGFSYQKLDDRLGRALAKANLGDDLEKLQIETEDAKAMGAYALGLAVGIRLAGGSR